VQRILINQANLYSTQIEPSSFAQLNTDAGAAVGIWIGAESRTCAEVVNELLSGVGAFGGFNRYGLFSVGLVAAPLGTEKATFTDEDIVRAMREPLPSMADPAVFRTLVGWQKNYTPQTDLAAGVTAARRTFAAQGLRVAKREDLSIQSRHLLAREYGPVASLYALEADAIAEAQRLFDLWSARRVHRLALGSLSALTRELGQVVVAQHARHGLSLGVAARILGHKVTSGGVELKVLV